MDTLYYSRSFAIGTQHRNTSLCLLEWVEAFVLAICPILQHYNGLVTEAGTELLLIAFPFICLKLLKKKRFFVKPLIPLALYALYISTIHGFTFFVFCRECLLLVYFIAVLNNGIAVEKYFKVAKAVGITAFWLLLLQYLLYYFFHYHLQLIPTGRLLESANQWIGLAETGRISVTGAQMSIYRPSAFFLEPSHLSIYCTPVLVLNLLSSVLCRKKIIESIMITLAMVLSTSGMGIMISAAVWGIYIAFYYGTYEKEGESFSNRNKRINALFYLIGIAILILGMYLSVGVFRSAVNRIFVSAGSGSGNAIQGRTSTGIRLLQTLSGTALFIGKGNTLRIADWNVSGFFYTVFQFGWIGCALYYWFYIKSLVQIKREYFWLALMIIILSFFTVHTFAAFYRMFFICLILGGYLRSEKLRGQKIVNIVRIIH